MNVSSEEVISIIAHSGVSADVSTLDGDASLRKFGIDSLEMMNVLLALEEMLHIKIPDEDVDALKTVNAIVAYLQEKQPSNLN